MIAFAFSVERENKRKRKEEVPEQVEEIKGAKEGTVKSMSGSTAAMVIGHGVLLKVGGGRASSKVVKRGLTASKVVGGTLLVEDLKNFMGWRVAQGLSVLVKIKVCMAFISR